MRSARACRPIGSAPTSSIRTRTSPIRPLLPGMVFNLENQFDVWEDWPGGTGCAYIEILLMTEKGLEMLSKLPRTLVQV